MRRIIRMEHRVAAEASLDKDHFGRVPERLRVTLMGVWRMCAAHVASAGACVGNKVARR
jgi:hypothetical protein